MRKIPFLLTSLLLAAGSAAQNHWWVSPTGNNANPGTSALPFWTINHANNVASTGDVIHLFAVTYGDEQGNVLLGNKTVTLVGAGQGQTRIKAHSTVDIMLNAGAPLPGAPEAHRPAVTVNGTGRVDIRDLTLDQGFFMPSTGRGYCLWVGGGADMVIDNVEFTNARANPIDGIQGPLAVNIRGDLAGNATRVEMHDCLVHEFGKGGVVANFNAHLIMDDCRVRGFDHAIAGLAAQNGIQVSRGASCEIRRTTITNCWYDPTTDDACGILLFDAGTPVLVEDCSFGNCEVGIFATGLTPSVISGTIRRNRVHTAAFAWYVDTVSGLTVTDNSFSVSQSGDNNDAQDDSGGGNSYSGNNYSSVSTAGPHLLPGTGAETDPTGKPTVRGLGASVATLLPAGHSPQDMVVTDLGGSSSPDFATVNEMVGTPSLAIGINNGAGVFTVSSVSFGAVDGKPVAIVAGEFNGAPGRDLAVLTINETPALTENKVYVFANNGSGVFSLLHTHPLAGATAPNDLAAGQLDNIANDDLVVADLGTIGGGSVTVLRNNGTGTAFVQLPLLLPPMTVACRGVTIGDFDGDATNDVAATEGNASNGRLHLWRGLGLGAFAPFAGSPLTTSLNANQVLATDLEGDGDQDLLLSATRDAIGVIAGAVDVFENLGAATFKRTEWRCDEGPAGLAAGDFDADADPDSQRRDAAVVNMTAGSVSVLGTWTSGCGYGSGGIAALTMSPTAVAIADINGDGFADLAYCSAPGTVTVVSGVTQARSDSYGAGSTGTSGRVPYLMPLGNPALPVQPNPSFGLGLSNALPFAIAAFAAGTSSAPILPDNILIGSIGATWVVVVNSVGTATVPLPIPVGPPLIGLPLFCQAGVFDPNATASIFPGMALTKALKIRIGN